MATKRGKGGCSWFAYRVYADPAIHDREQQRIFRGPAWHFLGLEDEVPEACDYKTVHVGDTPVILARDEHGRLHAMVNRCVHRGNLVCIKASGNDGARLTCVYHNWTYDLRGNLASVAFVNGVGGKGGMPKDFDRARHRLRALRVETVFGLVFATFSDDAPALEDYLGAEMRDNMERVLGRKMRVLGAYRQYMPNNWR